ncbi:MAG TPA: hypothetical protein PKE40_11065 [Arachnia sp.]|nr:hypothetical protein [Arachnia sp.]HMT86883.1 hypothetical protein [Arachnia sp.]
MPLSASRLTIDELLDRARERGPVDLGPFLVLGGSSRELAVVDLALEDLPNLFGS